MTSRNTHSVVIAVIASILFWGCGNGSVNSTDGGDAGDSGPSGIVRASSLSADHAAFEGLALDGGIWQVGFRLAYGGGVFDPLSDFVYARSLFGAMADSPLGKTVETNSHTVTLSDALRIPGTAAAGFVSNGAFVSLGADGVRAVNYVPQGVRIDYLNGDGTAVARSLQWSEIQIVPLAGALKDAPIDLLAALPFQFFDQGKNLRPDAGWLPGSAYVRAAITWAEDAIQISSLVIDKENNVYALSSAIPSTGPVPFGDAGIEALFPLILLNLHPTEILQQDAGDFQTIQGLRTWVSRRALYNPSSGLAQYRVLFEREGAVYGGYLNKKGSLVRSSQFDGTQPRKTTNLLNAAAIQSIVFALEPNGVANPAAKVGDSRWGPSVDLYGAGGSGPNGALASPDLRRYYNVPANLDGDGQAVAIVDAPGTGDFEGDLNVYSRAFGLPECTVANGCFNVLNLRTSSGPIEGFDWGGEIALDLQMVHALAPKAKLFLVIASSASAAALREATRQASLIPGISAISMSYGGTVTSENIAFVAGQDLIFQGAAKTGGIAVFVSSGDRGTTDSASAGEVNGVDYPAASPYATCVGGTTINAVAFDPKGTESAWEFSGGGAASGFGLTIPRPPYQDAVANQTPQYLAQQARILPDVSAVADPRGSGVLVYIDQSWEAFGGTSASAPIWGGIAALLSQYANNKGQSLQEKVRATDYGFNELLYRTSASAPATFYDVVSGSNAAELRDCATCSAQPGYDQVTGLGSPNVQALAERLFP